MTAGTKHDQGKAPWHLVPWDALEQVVLVLRFGAQKYAERNWEGGIVYSRLFAATQRHLLAWWQNREEKDPETGLSPLAHAACDVLFLLAHAARGTPELDDRPQVQTTTSEGASVDCAHCKHYIPGLQSIRCNLPITEECRFEPRIS